ncbi:MAG TPA: PLP-dependent aminotransferase family protein [Gemmatimonadales bacterium]|nr:PLP-dependent aminotransferase family protein [Gemmatimonadales bacterium]
MPKRAATLPLALPPREFGVAASQWLSSAIRSEILEGRLRPGGRLPATRDLARQYALSRGTVVSAFDRLRAEGYVEAGVGSGTYVSRVLPDDLLHVSRRPLARAPVAGTPRRRLSRFGRRIRPFPGYSFGALRAFRTDQPALDLFPADLWAKVASRRLRRVTTRLLYGSPPLGYPPLQEAVAAYLGASRGVRCRPDQIAIISGVQEALDLTARLLLEPGDRVCIESPGYVGAVLAFEAAGARVTPVPVDGEGMTAPPPRFRSVRLAYVTPGHQFPLGVCMSLRRRLAVLEWARATGAMVFEDDYDSEYRYAGRPLPSLQGLDRHGLVLFAGSFSKVLFPAIRLGYLLVPPDLVDRFAAVKSVASRHAPLLDQAVLCDFITEGHFGRHVRRMREIYAERRAVLLDAAREQLGGLLEIVGVEAGLQTAGRLGEGLDGATAAKAAAARDVEVTPLSRYAFGRQVPEGLQLGFAAVDAAEIRRGVRDLAAALEPLRARPAHGGVPA